MFRLVSSCCQNGSAREKRDAQLLWTPPSPEAVLDGTICTRAAHELGMGYVKPLAHVVRRSDEELTITYEN